MKLNIKVAIGCIMVIVSFYGCGGGGSGGDGGTVGPANMAPTVNAGADQALTFLSGTQTVTLTGTSNDSDGTVVSHQWVQTGGTGVTITGAATSAITFSVPAATEAYSFVYTVTDDDGAQVTDTVAVYVTEIVFEDSLGSLSNWQIENAPDPESWSANGALLQESSVIDFVASYHLGTYAKLNATAVSGITNYRFSVDVTPLSNGGSQGNDVGIMFRYNGPNSYYRVSMSARYGFTRFEKRVGNTFQPLAVNARGYVDNQPMTMAAEVNGDTIVVWIDGDPVFALEDPNPIPSGTVALYCQDRARFDNVLITENPLQPTVVIASPLAYSVLPGDLVDLTVTAVVLNKPAGGSVAFNLDGGSDIPATGSGNLYSHVFPSVFNGNHDVTAIIRYADDTEASSDTNSMVGTGGDYYVTVGDSITNGVGDLIASNNDSADERIVSIQGYQARLADTLTTATDRPQIVFNEGTEGETAAGLNINIDSILDRHPGANKVLMMVGTNDSDSGGVDPVIFGNRVEAIATTIGVEGKKVWLAETLPTNVIPANNTLIQQYNTEIREIASLDADDGIFLGPDLYDAFDDMPGLYTDLYHPNDAGYRLMADEWAATLP
jgi:lysophospholipase L1-like esterase